MFRLSEIATSFTEFNLRLCYLISESFLFLHLASVTFFMLQFDPNGRQCLTMAGYRNIGEVVRKLSEKHSEGRILIVQEGGYHVTYSAYCLHATLEGILNLPAPLLSDPIAYYPEVASFTFKVVDAIKQNWKESIPFFK